MNAEDADEDTEGGVVQSEGDVDATDITGPGCSLSNDEGAPTLFNSSMADWDVFDVGIAESQKLRLGKFLVAADIVKDPDIEDEFAKVDEFNLADVSLLSLSWLLSVVIFIILDGYEL